MALKYYVTYYRNLYL